MQCSSLHYHNYGLFWASHRNLSSAGSISPSHYLSLIFSFPNPIRSNHFVAAQRRNSRHQNGKSSTRRRQGEVRVKGKKENVWSIDNEIAKAEKERGGRTRQRGRKVMKSNKSKGGRVLVSGSMLMEVETVLQTQEPVIRPVWNTFASSVSGIWNGVGAVFSPITAEMEPVEIGKNNENLYDCYTLSCVEAIPSPSGVRESQIRRKVNWVTLNSFGEIAQNNEAKSRSEKVSIEKSASLSSGEKFVLPKFESFNFDTSDVMEEDVMGNEPGLVFFERYGTPFETIFSEEANPAIRTFGIMESV